MEPSIFVEAKSNLMEATISKEYIKAVRDAIDSGDYDFLNGELENLHESDVTFLLEHLNREEALTLFKQVSSQRAGEILVGLNEDLRKNLISDLSPENIVEDIIHQMSSDDAADFVNELPGSKQEAVLDQLTGSLNRFDQQIIKLIQYEPDTAGGLMATELIRVNAHRTVFECQEEIRKQADRVEDIYAVFVVDNQNQLKGFIPLKRLILSNPDAKAGDIYEEELLYVEGNTSGEEVANIMQKYDLVALPVVNKKGQLIGRITIDDVVDFIKEEAEEDYQLMSGISEDVAYSDRIWVLSRARLPWLLLGLVGGIANAKIISTSEGVITMHPEMAFFMPLIAAMGGNTGIQASAIVVQGLASNTLASSSFFTKLLKELSVSLINGLLCAVVLLGYGLLFTDSFQLSLTISMALFSVIIVASFVGVTIPLILDRFRVDPALATGPFITTTNDLVGMAIYFFVGRLMFSLPL